MISMDISKRRHYDGFVSIFTVMVIMSVLTIIAIGFATITHQAQKRVLDNQLSVQAYYAAESGINDATTALDSDSSLSKSSCKDASDGFKYDIDIARGVSYTCLLIDSTPDNLLYDGVPTIASGNSIVSNLRSTNGDGITTLNLSWDAESGGSKAPVGASATPAFTNASTWGQNLGILKLDIVPFSSLQRTDLVDQSYSVYLYPTTNIVGVNIFSILPGSNTKGQVLLTRCATSNSLRYRCDASVNLAGSAYDHYLVRLATYYNSVDTQIEALNSSATVLELADEQALVDSTGKANDVLRRIQARVPLGKDYSYKESFSLASGDSFCKRLFVGATFTEIDGGVFASSDSAVSENVTDSDNPCSLR
jgi:Tfp pilus assembly protein PilX